MDFDGCLDASEAMSGQLVQVRTWGSTDGSHLVAEMSGVLQRMGEVDLPPDVAEAIVGETAVTFVIGDYSGYLNLWRSSFVGAEMWKHPPDWLTIRTSEARIHIGPKRPAWSD